MQYWPTNTEEIVWRFPNNMSLKDDDTFPDGLFLELRNDVGLWILDGEVALAEITPGYLSWIWSQDLDGPFPPTGEYTYTLYAYDYDVDQGEWVNERVLDSGLMITGEFDYKPTQIDEIAVEYEQYGQQIIF